MPLPRRVTVGSRASPLSLAQNEEVLAPLRKAFPGTEFAVETISTRGDRDKAAPLLSMDRGMFVGDIRAALDRGEIDLAIHSAKDVPGDLPPGTVLAPVGARRDARDVLVNRWGAGLGDLPPGARLGTSSPRRTAQLGAARRDVEFKPIRGNVDTRLEKARGADYDGVVLAAAGLIRLGREAEVSQYLPPDVCTPDVGQGTLVAEVRSGDAPVLRMLGCVRDEATDTAFRAERAFLGEIGGGCRSPVAAYACLSDDRLVVRAMAATPDGSRLYRVKQVHDPRAPEDAGRRVAEALLSAGARDLLVPEAPEAPAPRPGDR